MGRRKRPALPAGLEQVRSRVEHWRKTRKKRTSMPEVLWDAASQLARVHGIHPVARALRLNYEALKRRVHGSKAKGQRRRSCDPVFVELDHGHLPAGLGECVVELADRRGAKMTVRMQGASEVDLVGLAGAFWNRRRR